MTKQKVSAPGQGKRGKQKARRSKRAVIRKDVQRQPHEPRKQPAVPAAYDLMENPSKAGKGEYAGAEAFGRGVVALIDHESRKTYCVRHIPVELEKHSESEDPPFTVVLRDDSWKDTVESCFVCGVRPATL